MKTKFGPHIIHLATSLYIIATSIYDISEDLTKIRKEHGLFLIGIVYFIKILKEIKENLIKITNNKTMQND